MQLSSEHGNTNFAEQLQGALAGAYRSALGLRNAAGALHVDAEAFLAARRLGVDDRHLLSHGELQLLPDSLLERCRQQRQRKLGSGGRVGHVSARAATGVAPAVPVGWMTWSRARSFGMS